MKRFFNLAFAFAVIVLLPTAIFAQTAHLLNVPENVQNTFNQQFPEVDVFDTTIDADGNFYFEFWNDDDVLHQIKISSSAEHLSTAFQIDDSDLPPLISDYLSRYYEQNIVREIFKVNNNQQEIFYEVVTLGINNISLALKFDVNGLFLEEQKKPSIKNTDDIYFEDINIDHDEYDDNDDDNDDENDDE